MNSSAAHARSTHYLRTDTNRTMADQTEDTDAGSVSSSGSCEQADSEPKHTPGPWEVWEPHGEVYVIPCDMDDNVARLLGSPNWDWKELKANANLIAAAPELLEAAKLVLDELEYDSYEAVWRLAEAVAKAEGDA